MASEVTLPMRVVRKVLRTKGLGRAISKSLYLAGLRRLSGYSSRYSHFIPPEVVVETEAFGSRLPSFRMFSLNGHDRVVSELWWGGGYMGFEPEMSRFYGRLVKCAEVIVGVGANSGFYELVAAVYSDSSQIYAFEPFPPALESLEANIRLNGFESRIHVEAKAVADKPGTAQLYVPEKRFGETLESSASLNKDFRPGHDRVIDVPVTTLDQFARENGLSRMDILRIDVESFEHAVLKGAREVLRNLRPIIAIEILEAADCATIEAIRAETGYRSFYVAGRDIVPQHSVVYREGHDNQILCPEEKTDELRDRLTEAGCEPRF